MVASALLVMVGFGILSVMIGAYRVAAKARYRDHARYVIKSMADQFLTQTPYDANNSGSIYPLFVVTVDQGGNAMPLGTGLSWTNTDGSPGKLSTDPLGQYFYVLIGDNTGTPIQATVTRSVSYLYTSGPGIGSDTLLSQTASAGYLIEGNFTITYPYLGQTVKQSVIAVRAIP
jgi:hypothetical protein